MNCTNCNSANQELSKFCNNCGEPLSPPNVVATNRNNSDALTTQQVRKKGGYLKLISTFLVSIVFISMVVIAIAVTYFPDSTISIVTLKQAFWLKEPEKSNEAVFNEQFKAEARRSLTYKELARNPQNYIDEKVVYTGKVIEVKESGSNVVFRINITEGQNGYDDTVYVTYKRKNDEPRILEDDIVKFWGQSKGLKTYESAMGGTVTIPQINALAIGLVQAPNTVKGTSQSTNSQTNQEKSPTKQPSPTLKNSYGDNYSHEYYDPKNPLNLVLFSIDANNKVSGEALLNITRDKVGGMKFSGVIKSGVVQSDYKDDGFGNKGTVKVTFKDNEILLEILNDEWNNYQQSYRFLKKR